MKAAVYSGTRNLYKGMVTAAKSLTHNSSVDRIYFLIEDDVFPEKLPSHIETLNVSGQKFFPKNGGNYRTSFTYMSLLRVCYTKLFPDLDRVLQLDVDTVCVDNVDALWDVDLTGKWYAAVEEHLSTYKPYGPKYYNIGVAVTRIRAAAPYARLVFSSYLPATVGPYVCRDAGPVDGVSLPVYDQQLDETEAYISETMAIAAEEHDATFVDVRAAADGNSTCSPVGQRYLSGEDGAADVLMAWHPTAAGDRFMADLLIPQITR